MAVESAAEALTIAVSDGSRIWKARRTAAPYDERLWPAAKSVLSDAGWRLSDIEAIGCSSGPGRFTGVRLGMGFAVSLGAALGVPVSGITLFEAVAHSLRSSAGAPRRFCVVLPAGHGPADKDGEFFIQAFGLRGASGPPIWVRASQARDPLIRLTSNGMSPLFGPSAAAAARVMGAGAKVHGAPAPWPVTAEHLLEPLLERAKAGRFGPCAPLYLKPASYQRTNPPK